MMVSGASPIYAGIHQFIIVAMMIGNVLTRTGQPQKGLEQILQTIRVATPTIRRWATGIFSPPRPSPSSAAIAPLGHCAPNTFTPGSQFVQVWLASIYATVGDKPNAARQVATLTKMAPGCARLFMQRPIEDSKNVDGRHGPRIFDGLRLALGSTLA
jgi:hypothetical protein